MDAPTLRTDRLVIRQARMSDAEALHENIGLNPKMSRFTGWNPYLTLESTRAKLASDLGETSTDYSWAIELEGAVIGIIGAYDFDPSANSYEIGYSVFQPYWGQGFATEAVKAAASHLHDEAGFTLRAWTEEGNVASTRLLENLAFRLCGNEGKRQFFALD